MRLIDADALINDIMTEYGVDPYYFAGTDIDGIRAFANSLIIERIASQPTVDAEPVRHGRWEYHSNPNIRGGMNPEDAYCSCCGYHVDTTTVNYDDYNYCPNCGAKMDGGAK